jgi:hypothetical protein
VVNCVTKRFYGRALLCPHSDKNRKNYECVGRVDLSRARVLYSLDYLKQRINTSHHTNALRIAYARRSTPR